MKKIFLALAAVSLVALCSCEKPNRDFTFIHMTDTQVGFLDESEGFALTDSLMHAAVEAVNRVHPAFVVITGDLLHNPADTLQAQIFKKNLALIDKGIDVYALPGNHDYTKFTPETQARFLDFMGYDRFSFKLNGVACIGIDSCRIKDDDVQAEEEQWNWLENELKNAQDCSQIYLFMHCPVIRETKDEAEDYFNFSAADREKYMELFKRYNVTAIFSGHTHAGYMSELDGIKMVNAGPVCPPLEHGFSGLAVVKVSENGFDYHYDSADRIGVE